MGFEDEKERMDARGVQEGSGKREAAHKERFFGHVVCHNHTKRQ